MLFLLLAVLFKLVGGNPAELLKHLYPVTLDTKEILCRTIRGNQTRPKLLFFAFAKKLWIISALSDILQRKMIFFCVKIIRIKLKLERLLRQLTGKLICHELITIDVTRGDCSLFSRVLKIEQLVDSSTKYSAKNPPKEINITEWMEINGCERQPRFKTTARSLRRDLGKKCSKIQNYSRDFHKNTNTNRLWATYLLLKGPLTDPVR